MSSNTSHPSDLDDQEGYPGWMQEGWAELGITFLVVGFRVIMRTMSVGFKGWQGDDWLILIAAACFTVSVVSCEVMYRYGTNQALTDEIAATLTPKQIQEIRVGSQWNFAGWVTYCTLIWACKGCMLYLYSRLTFNLWQKKLVTVCAWTCIVTYVASMLGNIFKCFPVQTHWQVVPPPGTCTHGLVNLYTMGITNLITDFIIVAIPIPLVTRVSLPLKKKIFVFAMLCSGFFVIAATIMRLVITLLVEYGKLSNRGYDLGFMLGWSNRENFVAVIIVNVPIIVSSLRRVHSRQATINSRKQTFGASYTNGSNLKEVIRSGNKSGLDTYHEITIERRDTQSDKAVSIDAPIDMQPLKIEKRLSMSIRSEEVDTSREDPEAGHSGKNGLRRSNSFLDL